MTDRADEKTETVILDAPWWRCLHCGCDEYEEHVFTGHMKGHPMIHCANCQVLHTAPDPRSPQALRWQISELAEALENLLYLQDFHDDREHWESEHKLGNGAAWRVLGAMDALSALSRFAPQSSPASASV